MSDRVYPGLAAQGAAYPRITMHRVSARRRWEMRGPVGLVTSRLQIALWSRAKEQVKDLARIVRELLDGFRGALGDEFAQLVQLIDEQELDERPSDGGEVPVFRVRQDYQITAEETRPNRL